MPSTDIQNTSSSSSSSSFGFSLMSRRRDQIHSMEATQNQEIESISFQKHVAERFQHLSSNSNEALLSIPWIRELLDTFLCCQEEFKMIVFNNQSHLNKPPMDRYMSEYFERTLKALDLCNAIRDGIEQIRQWHKLLEIVHCALSNNNHRTIGEGQFRRAKKAMIDLAISMLDDKDSNNSNVAHRNRSFGRSSNNNAGKEKSLGHFRSLSWSVSRNWSAARQLLAISSNLVAPRANEIASTNGLNAAVYAMNYVLLFVMWALVAAIPCQDRGLQTHFNLARQFLWGGPMSSLHERILEESKKRDRKNSCGLLKEIHEIEICARHVNELTDSVQFPLTEDKEREVKERVRELEKVCEGLVHGLDPLERQVREVFRRIVKSRTQGLDSIGD